MPVIYLAHPISSRTDQSSLTKLELINRIHECTKFNNSRIIDPSTYGLNDEHHAALIVERNMMDIIGSDAILADFTTASSGVAMEVMFARTACRAVFSLVGQNPSAWTKRMSTYCSDSPLKLVNVMMTMLEERNGI
jgi:hypothetical protein